MRSTLAMICLLLVLALAGCNRSGPDLSSPKSAALAFGKAMDSGDADTAKAASTGSDPKLIEVLARSAGSIRKLKDAAVARFGPEGQSLVAGETAPVDFEKPIADSEVKIDGDEAVMTDKTDPSKPLRLKKIDGQWKVDVASFEGITTLSPMVPAMEAVNAANDALAADITAGKYASVTEAEKAKTALTLSAINANSASGSAETKP